jgi:hypothetical protein
MVAQLVLKALLISINPRHFDCFGGYKPSFIIPIIKLISKEFTLKAALAITIGHCYCNGSFFPDVTR